MYLCLFTLMCKPHRVSVSSNLLLCPRSSAARAYTFVTTYHLVPIGSVVTTQGRAAGCQLWLHEGTSKMVTETFRDTLVKLRVGAAVSPRLFHWRFSCFIFVWFTFSWAIILNFVLYTYVHSVLAFSTQVRWFKPDWNRRILRRKNSQHAFLRRGNKSICPMS